MSLVVAFIAVIVLFAVGFFLGQIEGLQIVLGMFLPLLALVVFVGGFGYRMYLWAKIPVPWRIPTTAGQAKSLSFNSSDVKSYPCFAPSSANSCCRLGSLARSAMNAATDFLDIHVSS